MRHAITLLLSLFVAGSVVAQVASIPVPSSGVPAAAPGTAVPMALPQAVRPDVPARRVPRKVANEAEAGTDALLDERPDDALAHYQKAQVSAPDVPELEYNRGLAALLSGDGAEANKAFGMAQQLAEVPRKEAKKGEPPTPPELLEDSRYNLGHAAWVQDQVPQAVAGWASVVAKDAGADDARRNLELALRLVKQQQQEQQNQQQQDKDEQDQEQQSPKEDSPQGEKKDDEQKQPEGGGEDREQPPPEQGDQQQQPQGGAGQLTKEQAEDLLAALEAQEKQQMKEKMDKAAKRVVASAGKDW